MGSLRRGKPPWRSDGATPAFARREGPECRAIARAEARSGPCSGRARAGAARRFQRTAGFRLSPSATRAPVRATRSARLQRQATVFGHAHRDGLHPRILQATCARRASNQRPKWRRQCGATSELKLETQSAKALRILPRRFEFYFQHTHLCAVWALATGTCLCGVGWQDDSL